MNKHEFRKSDLIAIVGILMFAIVYAVDKLVYEMPKATFIVLVAIAMVLLIVGAIPEWLDLISHRTERIRFMREEEQRLANAAKTE